MEKRRFNIRKDLVITIQNIKGRGSYFILNPLTGKTVHFDYKTYLIFRHFNSRNILEVQKHLSEKHNLILSLKALESYLNLYLDLYLFEDCLDLYWERIKEGKKDILEERIAGWIKGLGENLFPNDSFVEGLLTQEIINNLERGKITSALNKLEDLKKINSKNPLIKLVYNFLEENIVKVKEDSFVESNSFISWKAIFVLVLLLLLFLLEGSFYYQNRITKKIIQATSEILVREKNLAL